MRYCPLTCWIILSVILMEGCAGSDFRWGKTTPTTIAIHDGQWLLNGAVTYPGTPAQGLLMNVRVVNSTFEDRNKTDWDPKENTRLFIQTIPDYAEQGIRAFTLNLQGGLPGYEGAVNSAFNPDGSLRPDYMNRMKKVIDACDRCGCAVILGCFYQRQDQILRDEDAIRRALVNAVRWIQKQGFKNIVLEIANEFKHGGFDHAVLKSPRGQVDLIRLVQQTAPELLVSTSGMGDGKMPESIAEAADFILIHFNETPVDKIPERIDALKKFGKPIVCNEDDKIGEQAAQAMEASVLNGASWGYMNKEVNQFMPLEFHGPLDDPILYEHLKKITSL